MSLAMGRLLLSKSKVPKGVTLIESLMAVVVVGVLLVSIAPLLALATAARVQARRVDQSTTAARGFLDGVTARNKEIDVIKAYTALVVPSGGCSSYSFDCVAPPGGTGIAVADLDKISGVKIDGNGNGFSVFDPQDYVIQPMVNENTARGVEVGARVYRADAFRALAGNPSQLIGTADGQQLLNFYDDLCLSAQVVFAGGSNRRCPLVFIPAQVQRN
jgi:prepilin-type N-terminal cleavage/methylation domain-containing protein